MIAPETTTEDPKSPPLISFLLRPESYPHATQTIEHIETHISHLFLTGSFAYKIKKPLNLGFLDFSTLEKRGYFTHRELTLNKRFAPTLYLDVLPLYEAGDTFSWGPIGEVVEYVLRMRQFNPRDTLTELLRSGTLTTDMLLSVVDRVVSAHHAAPIRPEYGSVESLEKKCEENLSSIERARDDANLPLPVTTLRSLFRDALTAQRGLIECRRSRWVRETHGDLHLGNVCLFEGAVTLFDALEFTEESSCTDVWTDFAFLFMDLISAERSPFAFLCLNRYLELTDDFEGLPLLKLSAAYRACVRAKIAFLRSRQLGDVSLIDEGCRYVSLAILLLQSDPPVLIAIGGLSGSGKSTTASRLGARYGAVVIRSDAVRKHIVGVPLTDHAPPDAYSVARSHETYRGLFTRAAVALAAGFSVIVDGVFLEPEQKELAESHATRLGVPFFGYWCEVSAEVARSRISQRSGDISDADVSVFESQARRPGGPGLWTPLKTEGDVDEVVSAVIAKLPPSTPDR